MLFTVSNQRFLSHCAKRPLLCICHFRLYEICNLMSSSVENVHKFSVAMKRSTIRYVLFSLQNNFHYVMLQTVPYKYVHSTLVTYFPLLNVSSN